MGRTAVLLLAAALCCAGCGDRPGPPRKTTTAAARPAPARPAPAAPRVPDVRCPAGAAPGCRSASGRVIYVEAVDPDGDGDAHFVLVSSESVTAPGISVIDVRRDLRPHPLPGRGDRVSAAGPVYTGSHGQKQVEAVAVRVTRRGR
jgi:hypothetical protein